MKALCHFIGELVLAILGLILSLMIALVICIAVSELMGG